MSLSVGISYANLTNESNALNLSLMLFQKVVLRRKDLGTRLKGAGAKEAAAAVLGTRQMVVDGTATRAGTPVVVAAGGKLARE